MSKRFRRFCVIALLISSMGWFGFSTYDSVRHFAEKAYSLATTAREQVTYSGQVNATPVGKPALALSAQSISADTQIILLLGRLIVHGKITPTTPATAMPTKLRITVKHNSATGKTLATANYDLAVHSDGTIPSQNLPVTDFEVFDVKDVLQLLVIPIDKALPAGRILLSANHSLGPLKPGQQAPDESRPEIAPQLVYLYTDFVENRAKGGTLGPYNLKMISQPGFALYGNLSISGKLTSDDAGVPEPTTLAATIQHKDAKTGKVLSTQTLTVHVQSNGQILNQVFPFSTINPQGIAESLQVVMKPVDRAFPYSTVNVRLAYTPSL